MLTLTVTNKLETQHLTHPRGPLEMGRGPAREGVPRVVVRDAFVSRDHVRLEELPGRRVRVQNLSTKATLAVDAHSLMDPGFAAEFPLPIRLGVGETVVEVAAAEPEPINDKMLRTINAPVRGGTGTHPSLMALAPSTSVEEIVGWLEGVFAVQKVSTPGEFYQQTANTMVERIGLDTGLVLLREGESWRVVAGNNRDARPAARAFSQTILNKVLADKRTFYMPTMPAGGEDSLVGVQGVVASPIFDVKDEVAGVVYGTRAKRGQAREIGPLEAQVVQLLAAAVGAGLVRSEQDAEASRLRVAKEAAEQADAAKSQFLAMVSHELRTPLTTIIGYTEMLLDQAAADKLPQYADDLRQIEGAGKHLLALINDILDLSKIQAGKFQLCRDPFDPATLFRDLMVAVGPLAKKHNNRLEADIPADLGPGVGDPTRVRQCVFNLVGNACKFTKDGVVKVSARRLPDAEGDFLTVKVSDTGIGMTPEQVARLGEPFEQVDPKFGGTGLGLAISMKLAAAMGGRITVESQKGTGSTFTMLVKAALPG